MQTPWGISIVISSKDPHWLRRCQAAIAKTTRGPHEIVVVDNASRRYSLARAYNIGAERARFDVLCFMHEDVLILTPQWDELVRDVLYTAPRMKIIGVVGTTLLLQTGVWWHSGRPYGRGTAVHYNASQQWFTRYSLPGVFGVCEVVAVDGLFMVARKSLMAGGKLFDDDTFTGFHFYDMDLCAGVSSREQGAIGVTHGILVAHEQKSDMTEWEQYRRLFVEKYRSALPLKTKDCVPGTPPSNWDVSELPDKAGMLPPWFWELRADWARSVAETTKPPS